MDIFQRIYFILIETSSSVIERIYYSIVDEFTGIFMMITALYFAVIAILWLQNKLGDFANEFLTSAILAAGLFEAVVSSRAYWNAAGVFFIDTPSGLSDFIASASGLSYGGIFEIVGKSQMSAFEMISKISAETSVFSLGESIGLWLGGWLLAFIMSTLTIAFFVFMVLSIFGVRIMMLCGIVAVFLASFRYTRHISGRG